LYIAHHGQAPILTGDACERRDRADGWGPAADGLTGSVVTAVREALRPAPVNIRRAADPVGMGVVTDDPAAAAPIIAQLRARPELGVRHVLPAHRGDVILALATTLSGGMLAELTSLAGQAGHEASASSWWPTRSGRPCWAR
jgi:hypothetical protein